MLDFLNHLIDLLGTNPSLTPWLLLIILFVLAAMAVARVGKIALSNVDTMMQQGEAQRERLEQEIHRKDAIIAARDKRIHELEDDQQTTITFVTGLRREQAELHDKIFELERTNRGLVHDYQRALEQLEDRRDDRA